MKKIKHGYSIGPWQTKDNNAYIRYVIYPQLGLDPDKEYPESTLVVDKSSTPEKLVFRSKE